MLFGGSFIVDYNYSDSKNDYNERNIDFESITEYDKEELYLLNIQHSADILGILSSILSYLSTVESFELIYNKYDKTPKRAANPDVPLVQSMQLLMVSRVMYTVISFLKYQLLYERKINGDFNFSLEPNVNANISNILRTLGTYYGLMAGIGIYNRDITRPIIGV